MSPLLLILLQTPAPAQAPAAPAASSPDFRQAPVVAEPNRLQITPKLDGKIEEEEWDALGASGDVRTYLQWEPGAIHVAAAAATGKDLLVSIDPGGDGWLVGSNNLQARIGVRDGKPFVKLQILDAANVAGPTYREIPGLEAASSAVVGPDGTIEATIVDPGLGFLPQKEGKLALRVDAIPSDAPPIPANQPRALTLLSFGDSRSAALPAGLRTKIDFNDISVVPGESLSIRFGFTGEPMPKRIALRTEGLGREATSASELPFLAAGKKGANVEYRTRVQPEASLGYRVARATLTGSDGVPAIVQASYRIAPLVDVQLNDARLAPSDKDRSVKIGYLVFGNSGKRLAGRASIAVPGNYRLLNGDEEQSLKLYEPRRGLPKSFGFLVPANAKGTVPIAFHLDMNGQKFVVVRYLTID